MKTILLIATLMFGTVRIHAEKWQDLLASAGRHQDQGDQQGAEQLYREAVAEAVKFGRSDTRLAHTRAAYAIFQNTRLKYQAAEDLMREALADIDPEGASDDPEVIACLHNLSVVLHHQGRYREALPSAQRALRIAEARLGTPPWEIAIRLKLVADLYLMLGAYPDAEIALRRALFIRKEATDHYDPVALAAVLQGFGALHIARGEPRKAESALSESLRILLSAGSPVAAESVRIHESMALLYQTLGTSKRAAEHWQAALLGAEKFWGRQHPETARLITYFGNFELMRGRKREAEVLMAEAVGICERFLSVTHPQLAESMQELALLYVAEHRYEEAVRLYRRSLVIAQTTFGPLHPFTGNLWGNLAQTLSQRGELGESEECYKRAIAIHEQTLGTEHPLVGVELNGYAKVLQRTKRPKEAEHLQVRAKSILQKQDERALVQNTIGIDELRNR